MILATTFVSHWLAHVEIAMLGKSRKTGLRPGWRNDKSKCKESLIRGAGRIKNWKWILRVNISQQCWVARIWRLRHGTRESTTEWPCSSGRHEQMPLFIPHSSYTGLRFWPCSSRFLPLILKSAKNNFKEPWETLGCPSPFELLPSRFIKRKLEVSTLREFSSGL